MERRTTRGGEGGNFQGTRVRVRVRVRSRVGHMKREVGPIREDDVWLTLRRNNNERAATCIIRGGEVPTNVLQGDDSNLTISMLPLKEKARQEKLTHRYLYSGIKLSSTRPQFLMSLPVSVFPQMHFVLARGGGGEG